MVYAPANAPVSLARHALTSAEKLSRQRRLAAEAHARAQAFQIKVAVVFTCVVGCPLAFGLYQGVSASKSNAARTLPAIEASVPNSEVRIGAIQLPYRGELCRQFQFDNQTGAITAETTARCSAVEVAPSEVGNSRAQAIMSAFKKQ
jgi:hypothetical protein